MCIRDRFLGNLENFSSYEIALVLRSENLNKLVYFTNVSIYACLVYKMYRKFACYFVQVLCALFMQFEKLNG